MGGEIWRAGDTGLTYRALGQLRTLTEQRIPSAIVNLGGQSTAADQMFMRGAHERVRLDCENVITNQLQLSHR